MEFKGTKGEWIVTEIEDSNGFIYVGKHKGDSRVATCYKVDEGWYNEIVSNETKANAQLIATAPELLKALQDVISSLGGEYNINDDVYKQSIKTINKALGND